jgi:RNA polymerase primary sigma factor
MTSNLAMIERRPPPARSGHQVGTAIVACVATTKEIDRRSRLGIAPVLDGELGRAESSGARHAVEMRARRMLEARIRFVGHPDFDDSTASAEILGPMPGPVGLGKGRGKAGAREIIPLSDADFQDSKFLTREQEVHLFRKMNFLKYLAAQLREAITPSRARSAEVDRIEELLREADAVRNLIIRSYLGLVVSIVKKFAEPSQDFLDLVSEGNFSLIKASERFDIERGARFSTYATWAIVNNFARRIPKDRTRRIRFGTGREELLQSLTDHRDSARADATGQEQSRYLLRRMLGYLNDREQMIIARRFGLAGDKQTLVQVGQELRISKERVRQLESRALDKLRALAMVEKLDLPDESTSGGNDGRDG